MNDSITEAFQKIINLNNEGIKYLKENKITEAKEVLTNAENKLKKTIREEGTDQRMYAAMILTLNNFCLMHKKKKNFDKSLDYLMRIKEIEVNNLNSSRLDIATTHLNISTIFHFQKKYDLAIRHVNGAKDILVGEINYIRELNGKEVSHNYKKKLYLNLILALYNRGVEYEKLGDKESSKKNYKDSRELAIKKFGIDQPITEMINENLRKNFGNKRKPFFVSKNINIEELISNKVRDDDKRKEKRGLLELAYPNKSQKSLHTKTHRSEDIKRKTEFDDVQSYKSHEVHTRPRSRESNKSTNSFKSRKSRGIRKSRSFSRKSDNRLPDINNPYHRISTPKSTQKFPRDSEKVAQLSTDREIDKRNLSGVRKKNFTSIRRGASGRSRSKELSNELMNSLHKYSASPKHFLYSTGNYEDMESVHRSTSRSKQNRSRMTGLSIKKPIIPALKHLKKNSVSGTTKSTREENGKLNSNFPPKKVKIDRVSFALKYMN